MKRELSLLSCEKAIGQEVAMKTRVALALATTKTDPCHAQQEEK